MDSKWPAFSAAIRTLVSRATGIPNYIGSRVHSFLQFFRLLFCELDAIKQINNLLSACASFAPDFHDRLAMPLDFRCFTALDDAVQYSLAVIGKLGSRYFHPPKIPILAISAIFYRLPLLH